MYRRFAVVVFLLLGSVLLAQRANETDGRVVYEDAQGNRTDLGAGFSPVLTHDGSVALLRGRKFTYGDEFDCAHKETRNWVAVYDPAKKSEEVLFDRAVPFMRGKWPSCGFEQMQLSPDERILYLVSPVYATSGSLAIIHLRSGSIDEVPGVNEVWVIETGPHRGDLIYWRRMWRHKLGDYIHYPFIHADKNGVPLRVISEECLDCAGQEAPVLKAYLKRIGGVITVNGRVFP
jgi:hypothetical protein